ncbi:MAG: RNA polymerase subunit sigma-24, partial [Thermoleophilaceae bacterium]
AIASWSRDGVPDRPGAWLTVAARRCAIDRLRRERGLADRIERLRVLAERESGSHEEDEEPGIVDDRLRLIFTCCHPALALEARVALTLRSLGGLTTGEIARAFLVA